jgi:excisionase family DNA binding protein
MPEGNLYKQNDSAVLDWARRVSIDQVPGLLLFLAARWLDEIGPKSKAENNAAAESLTEKLLTSRELAEHLNVHESWVRTEERLGRIPSVRLGRYVRFKLTEVERTLVRSRRRGT